LVKASRYLPKAVIFPRRTFLVNIHDFAEGFVAILCHQNNFVEALNIISNTAKNFDIPAINLSNLRNYFDSSTKLFF